MGSETNTQDKNLKPGIVWHQSRWRFFHEWEEVMKGAYKGFLKIHALHGTYYVKKMHVKRFPCEEDVVTEKVNKEQPWIVETISEGSTKKRVKRK